LGLKLKPKQFKFAESTVAKAPEIAPVEVSPKRKTLPLLTVIDDQYKEPAELSNKAIEYGDGLATTKIKQLRLERSSVSSGGHPSEKEITPRKFGQAEEMHHLPPLRTQTITSLEEDLMQEGPIDIGQPVISRSHSFRS